jgi:hypothetical protein
MGGEKSSWLSCWWEMVHGRSFFCFVSEMYFLPAIMILTFSFPFSRNVIAREWIHHQKSCSHRCPLWASLIIPTFTIPEKLITFAIIVGRWRSYLSADIESFSTYKSFQRRAVQRIHKTAGSSRASMPVSVHHNLKRRDLRQISGQFQALPAQRETMSREDSQDASIRLRYIICIYGNIVSIPHYYEFI